MSVSIRRRMGTGVAWMVAARLVDRSIGVVSTLVLARLLVPEDFGLVAMATAIGGLLDLLGSFSFDLALIQRKDAGRAEYDTVWTFNVAFGLFCAVALAILAVPAAHFYREPRLEAVMYVLAGVYAVGGFGNIGVVNFRKELAFGLEFRFMMVKRLTAFVVTLGAAYLLRSYWGLLIGTASGAFAALVASYVMSSYRPRFALGAAPHLFHFSKWLFLHNLLVFLHQNGPKFVIGRVDGAQALGVYSVAYEIATLPSSELVAPINRATFPGFAKIADRSEFARTYLQLFALTTLLILPMGIGIAAVADPLIRTLLGERWVDAIALIQLLGIYGGIMATQSNNGVVWIALGHPRDVSLVAALFVLVLIPGVAVGLSSMGTLGIGWAYIAAQLVCLPVGLWITKRRLGERWRSFVPAVWRPVMAVILMYAVVSQTLGALPQAVPALRLLAGVGAGVATYVLGVLVLWWVAGRPDGAERVCLARLRSSWSRPEAGGA